MTQTCMPKVDTGAVAVEVEAECIGYKSLGLSHHRETKTIKFNGERIVTCKTTNRDKVFN